MRPAAKRLLWVPASAGLLAVISGSAAAWATLTPLGLALAAIILSRILASLIFRLDRLRWRRLTFRDAVTAALACGGGSAIAAAVCVGMPGPWPARLLVGEAALYFCMTLALAAAPRLRELRTQTVPANAVRTLIWGAGAAGHTLLEMLRRTNPVVEVFGWLDDDPVLAELDCDGLPVLGPIESLPLLVELHGVRSVLVAIPHLSPERRAFAEDLAKWSGVRLSFTPSIAPSSELQALAVIAPNRASQPSR